MRPSSALPASFPLPAPAPVLLWAVLACCCSGRRPSVQWGRAAWSVARARPELSVRSRVSVFRGTLMHKGA